MYNNDSIYNSLFAYQYGKELSNDTFKVGNMEVSTPGAIMSGATLLNSISSNNQYKQRNNINQKNIDYARNNDYVNTPYNYKYQYSAQDNFNPSAFGHGGEYNRYKIFEEGGSYDNWEYTTDKEEYTEGQNGFVGTNVGKEVGESSSSEEFIRNNPMDYDMIQSYVGMFSDNQDVSVDPMIDLMDYDGGSLQFSNNDNYEGISNGGNNSGTGRIYSVVEDFKKMGLNPSSVDTGTHNKNSSHNIGNAADFGLNTTFGGDHKKMEDFKNWFETEGQHKYPGLKLHDERTHPKGQKVWNGSHFHLEY